MQVKASDPFIKLIKQLFCNFWIDFFIESLNVNSKRKKLNSHTFHLPYYLTSRFKQRNQEKKKTLEDLRDSYAFQSAGFILN